MQEHSWKEHRLRRELSTVRTQLQELREQKNKSDRERRDAVSACHVALKAFGDEPIGKELDEQSSRKFGAVLRLMAVVNPKHPSGAKRGEAE